MEPYSNAIYWMSIQFLAWSWNSDRWESVEGEEIAKIHKLKRHTLVVKSCSFWPCMKLRNVILVVMTFSTSDLHFWRFLGEKKPQWWNLKKGGWFAGRTGTFSSALWKHGMYVSHGHSPPGSPVASASCFIRLVIGLCTLFPGLTVYYNWHSILTAGSYIDNEW